MLHVPRWQRFQNRWTIWCSYDGMGWNDRHRKSDWKPHYIRILARLIELALHHFHLWNPFILFTQVANRKPRGSDGHPKTLTWLIQLFKWMVILFCEYLTTKQGLESLRWGTIGTISISWKELSKFQFDKTVSCLFCCLMNIKSASTNITEKNKVWLSLACEPRVSHLLWNPRTQNEEGSLVLVFSCRSQTWRLFTLIICDLFLLFHIIFMHVWKKLYIYTYKWYPLSCSSFHNTIHGPYEIMIQYASIPPGLRNQDSCVTSQVKTIQLSKLVSKLW